MDHPHQRNLTRFDRILPTFCVLGIGLATIVCQVAGAAVVSPSTTRSGQNASSSESSEDLLELLLDWLIRLLEQAETRESARDINAKAATFYQLAMSDALGSLSSDETGKLESTLSELQSFIVAPPPSLSAESRQFLEAAHARLVERIGH